ncbi:50S ribosomal protein L21 [Desulfonatronospira sp.]|uniref:50S ribosomal protein L21 n=1 Tax=Desulfonatronospira sp. TaxID=1962951 RepID=UPI0025BBEC81|nr:50S ribosomal protein L21 [Desulfonatronospira sp.]
MFAIVESGGKQYRVREGQRLKVARMDQEPGEEIVLDSVLAVGQDEEVQIGKPYLEDARVICDILEHDRDKKVIIFKKKRRKGYSKKQGHRQDYTALQVKSIQA